MARGKKPPATEPRSPLEELLARTDGYLAETRKVIAAARATITQKDHR